jgi:hypothetical protein
MLKHLKWAAAIAAVFVLPSQASANNYGESLAWQFQTTTDKVNQAIIQDLIQKRKHGMYAAPVYNTTIEKQFNCTVQSSAIGNNGTNTMVGNSPTTSGAVSNATGNNNSTDVHSGKTGTGNDVTGSQDNSGQVHSSIDGGTSTDVKGDVDQVLNSTQTNSGNQSASVSGSTGCAFGPLN